MLRSLLRYIFLIILTCVVCSTVYTVLKIREKHRHEVLMQVYPLVSEQRIDVITLLAHLESLQNIADRSELQRQKDLLYDQVQLDVERIATQSSLTETVQDDRIKQLRAEKTTTLGRLGNWRQLPPQQRDQQLEEMITQVTKLLGTYSQVLDMLEK